MTTTKFTTKQIAFFFAGMILLLSAIIYFPSLNGEFVYDDAHFITDNPFIKNLRTFFFSFFSKYATSQSGHGIWRPVRTLSFALDYRLWGLNPFGFHLLNLILHATNALLIMAMVKRLYRDGVWQRLITNERSAQVVAGLCALLWLAHPVQVEAVSWISSRGDLLFAFFYLVSFLLYRASRQHEQVGIVSSIASQLAFCAALLSKESAVTLPLVFVLYDRFILPLERRPSRSVFTPYRPYIFLSLIYLIIRSRVLEQIAQGAYWGGSLYATILMMLKVMVQYFTLLIWPAHLRILYMISPVRSLFEPAVMGSSAVLMLVAGAAFLMMRRCYLVRFGCLWFVVHLLPVAQIIPLSGGMMAEHFLYMPSFGFILIICYGLVGLYHFAQRYTLRPLFVVGSISLLLITGASARSLRRSADWQNNIRLWRNEQKYSPRHHKVYSSLGNAFHMQGDYDIALDYYDQAIALKPDDAEPYFNKADIYTKQGHLAAALIAAEQGLILAPENPNGYANKAAVLQAQGHYKKAIHLYYRAIELYPYNADFYYNLGLAYDRADARDKAVIAYNQALHFNPDHAAAYNNLGIVFHKQGKFDQAAEAWCHALECDPDLTTARENLNRLQEHYAIK